jgi:hypothetical protein
MPDRPPPVRAQRSAWLDQIVDQLPLVQRRTLEQAQRAHERLLQQHERLLQALAAGVPRPADAPFRWLKEPRGALNAVVCLLAAPLRQGQVPRATAWMARQHLAVGHRVLLILGTADLHATPVVDPALLSGLAGVLLRSNWGADLGAWAQAHHLLRDRLDPRRLVLLNDELVGPIDETRFDQLWARIDGLTADVIGFTEASRPHRHLRRDALLFGREAWLAGHVGRMLDSILAFDDPALMFEVHESRLTRQLQHAGLRCEALFPLDLHAPTADPALPPAPAWARLLDQGFPYVRQTVLRDHATEVAGAPLGAGAPRDVKDAIADVSRSRRASA